MTRNELQKLAREQGLKTTGTTEQLAQRLLDAEIARRRSRRGMTVVAKGDKVAVFRAAAEKAGYEVGVKKNRQTSGTVAYAVKGEKRVTAAWTSTGSWDRIHTGIMTPDRKRASKIRNLAQAIQELA